MTNELEDLAEKLYSITNPSCLKNCPIKYPLNKSSDHCCCDFFCFQAEIFLKRIGKQYRQPNYMGMRYLSENGCIVPPKYRPLCSGFGCITCLNDISIKKSEFKKLKLKLRKLYNEFMKGNFNDNN